jgi:hypothetical protein
MISRVAVLSLLVASACGPYSFVTKADPNPLAGQKVLMIDSLLFQSAEVDGLPEDAWIAGQNDTWKAEWPSDQARASSGFANALKSRLARDGITLTPQANPQGATLLLKPNVTNLETGGWRPTIVTISVKLVDVAKNAPIEEISTRVKVKSNFDKFEDRLDRAVLLAADNVAVWVRERVGL